MPTNLLPSSAALLERPVTPASPSSHSKPAPIKHNQFMASTGRRKSMAVFITLGVLVGVLALSLNVGYAVFSWRTGVMIFLGTLFSLLIIAGATLNTIFLVREIRRNEQHDRFINAVTHELKTPVASIRLYLETLQKRELDDAKRREFYDIMLADSLRLTQTIEQVLRAGQIKNSSANRMVLNLGDLVKDCVALARVRHHLPEEAVQFEGDSITIRGDLDELRAAISNLLDNAIKYSTETVRVIARVMAKDPETVSVQVIDRGVGIPQNELKRVFRRFYRIPGAIAVRVKGTGLGLFIVDAAAKKHGGKVFAESAGVGQGSTFTIELPRAPQV